MEIIKSFTDEESKGFIANGLLEISEVHVDIYDGIASCGIWANVIRRDERGEYAEPGTIFEARERVDYERWFEDGYDPERDCLEKVCEELEELGYRLGEKKHTAMTSYEVVAI